MIVDDSSISAALISTSTVVSSSTMRSLCSATGTNSDGRIVPPYSALTVAAFRGREADVTRLVRTSTDQFNARGEGLGITVAHWVTSVVANGHGRYETAFEAAELAIVDPHEFWFSTFAIVELIEAATRCGHEERAVDALAPFPNSRAKAAMIEAVEFAVARAY